MKKINKKNIIDFFIIFVITCIIFIPFLTGHYATDTYNVVNIGYHEYAIKWSLNDGRIFMAIIVLLADKLNLSIEIFTFITLFLALIVSSICVIIIKNIIERFKKPQNVLQNILVTIISYVTIFNFMYIENLYFVECFVMSISLLLFILAADILVRKDKNSEIKSLLLVIVGIMFYQGSICMFFVTTLLISILKNKNNIKQIIIDIIESGIIALVAVLLNIGLVKIIGNIYGMEQERLGKVSQIFSNILKIIRLTPMILTNSCGQYPNFLYLVFVTVIMFLTIAYFKNDKKGDITIIKLVAIFVMGILSSSIIFILAFTSFYSGRLRLAIGATIGMLFIILYTDTNIFEDKRITKYLATGLLLLYLISNVGEYIYLMNQHKEVNRLEKIDVQEIDNYIKDYENQTGIKVTKIVNVRVIGKEEKAYYSSIKNQSTFTFTAIRSDLAANAVINFYTNRNLELVDISYKKEKEISEIISNSEEKEMCYKCIDDTFYIEVYMF